MSKTIDFSRSFLWWRTDTLEIPPLTQTNKAPFTLQQRPGAARLFVPH